MAIANRIARACYHIIKEGQHYKELGEIRADTIESQKRRAVSKLKKLGFEVELREKSIG